MANIPVERIGGTPWWTWALALVAVIGLIWLIVLLFGNEPDPEDRVAADTIGVVDDRAAQDPANAGMDPVGAAGTLTSLAEVREARRQDDLYGREVELSGVRAARVAGDSTFYIEDPDPSGDARLLVVLENLEESETDPAGPEGSDGVYNINEGEVMTVRGRVDRFTGAERQVTGANRDRLLPDSLYLDARRITSAEDRVRAQ